MPITTTKTERHNRRTIPVEFALQNLHLPTLKIDKKTILLQKGDACQKFFLVKRGLIKQFKPQFQKNQLKNIFMQGHIAASLDDFIHQRPSDSYFEAIAGTEVAILEQHDIDLLENYIEFFNAKLIRYIKELEAKKCNDDNFLLLMALYKKFEA